LSNNNTKSTRIFFGWWTVFVTGLISGLGHGYYQFGISVFFKDIAAELGMNRAVTSVAAGIGRLEGGVTSPLTGWLSDKYGPKWVVFSGICISGIGMIMMNFISTVWSYIIVWGLIIGVGLNIGLTVAVDKSVNDWFINKRGLAMGTKFALIGVVVVALLPIVTWLVTTQGWRMTCLIWGVIMLVSSPFTLIFVKQNRPEHYGLLPDGIKTDSDPKTDMEKLIIAGASDTSSSQETDFSFRQAIRTYAYWLLCIVFSIHTMVSGALNIHLIPFLTDLGIDRATAGGMMGVMVFFSIPSRLLGGITADRVGKNHMHFLMAGVFSLLLIGITWFLISQSIVSIYAFLIFYGFSSGAFIPLLVVMIGSYFGRKAFGSILGSSMAIRAPLSLVAPVFAGWVYDTTQSYETAFILFAALAAIAILFLCMFRPSETKGDNPT